MTKSAFLRELTDVLKEEETGEILSEDLALAEMHDQPTVLVPIHVVRALVNLWNGVKPK